MVPGLGRHVHRAVAAHDVAAHEVGAEQLQAQLRPAERLRRLEGGVDGEVPHDGGVADLLLGLLAVRALVVRGGLAVVLDHDGHE